VRHLLAAHFVNRVVQHATEHVEAHRREVARLLPPENVARSTHLQIERCHLEAAPQVRVSLERLDARAALVAHGVGRRHDEVAVGPLRAAAHTPSQLIELSEAKEIRAVDDHCVGPRYVQAALDDGRANEDVVAPVDEVDHRLFERLLGHLPVRDGDPGGGHELLETLGLFVKLLDSIEHVKALPAPSELALERVANDLVVPTCDDRSHGAPISRSGGDEGQIAKPGNGHLQRARNRGCGQREHVDLGAQLLDPFLVSNAKALFFVDHEQPEALEVYILRQQPVGSHDDVDFALLEAPRDFLLLLFRLKARKRPDRDWIAAHPRVKGSRVLLHEHGRRA
jgi:hypothetical protein